MVQIDSGTLTALIVVPALIALMLGYIGSTLQTDFKKRGKAQVFFYNPDSHSWKETWQKLGTDNEFLIGSGEAAKRIILDGAARLPTKWGTWIVNPVTGHNYVGERMSEFVDKNAPLHLRLLASNPSSYHMQTVVNRQRAALNANQKDDKLETIKIIVIAGVIGIVAVLGLLGFVAWKITSMSAAGSG